MGRTFAVDLRSNKLWIIVKYAWSDGFYNYTKNNNLPEMPLTAVAISVETEDWAMLKYLQSRTPS